MSDDVKEVNLEQPSVTGFDISEQKELAKKEDEGITLHLEGVDGKPMFFRNSVGEVVPVTITVAGSNSDRFKDIENRIRKRKLKPRQLTGDTLHNDQIEKAAYCTLRWEGILDKGNPVRCDHANALALYKHLPFVLRQVIEAMDDHESFFSNGSQTSSNT